MRQENTILSDPGAIKAACDWIDARPADAFVIRFLADSLSLASYEDHDEAYEAWQAALATDRRNVCFETDGEELAEYLRRYGAERMGRAG